MLGHEGPYVELQPKTSDSGPHLNVYTSRARVPAETYDEAERMPFAELLDTLEPGVGLMLNPDGPRPHRISADELELLRRVLATE